MSKKYKCPKCGSDCVITFGKDGRRFIECENPTCTFNYKNISKEVLGRNRRHFKLVKGDYVDIHKMYEDYTIGFMARHYGISRKQIRRILNLNLSRYAERVYGEMPC